MSNLSNAELIEFLRDPPQRQLRYLCRTAADRIERLQCVLDSRPAINAGLPDTYARWSQSIYAMEALQAGAGGARQ